MAGGRKKAEKPKMKMKARPTENGKGESAGHANRGKTYKFLLHGGCGHTSRCSIFPKISDPGVVWEGVEDGEGPMNILEITEEFQKMLYMETIAWLGGKNVLNHMYIEELLGAMTNVQLFEPIDIANNVRSLQHFGSFPLDCFRISNYVSLTFRTHSGFRDELLVADRDDVTVRNLRSFAATCIGRNYPNSCAFLLNTPVLDRSGNGPFCRVVAVCQVPMCKLKLMVVFPDVPNGTTQPYEFVLCICRDRKLAFRSRSYRYDKSSNTFASQKIGLKCPHCIYTECVTESVAGRLALESTVRGWYRNATNPSRMRKFLLSGDISTADIFEQIGFLHRTKQKDKESSKTDKQTMPVEKKVARQLMGLEQLDEDVFQNLYDFFKSEGHRNRVKSYGNDAIFDIHAEIENFDEFFESVNMLDKLPSLRNQIKFIRGVAGVRCGRKRPCNVVESGDTGGEEDELDDNRTLGEVRRQGKQRRAVQAPAVAHLSDSKLAHCSREVARAWGDAVVMPKVGKGGKSRAAGIAERVTKIKVKLAQKQGVKGKPGERQEIDFADLNDDEVMHNENGTDAVADDSVEMEAGMSVVQNNGERDVGGHGIMISSLAKTMFGVDFLPYEEQDVPFCCCHWLLKIVACGWEHIWIPTVLFDQFCSNGDGPKITVHDFRICEQDTVRKQQMGAVSLEVSESLNVGQCCPVDLRKLFGGVPSVFKKMKVREQDKLTIGDREYLCVERAMRYAYDLRKHLEKSVE